MLEVTDNVPEICEAWRFKVLWVSLFITFVISRKHYFPSWGAVISGPVLRTVALESVYFEPPAY